MSGDGLEDLWLSDNRGYTAHMLGLLTEAETKIYLEDNPMARESLNDATPEEWDKVSRDQLSKIRRFAPNVGKVPLCPTRAIDKQEGGNHYKKLKIQPIEYIQANNLSYEQGNVVKYITRYENKGGIEDLRKAIHFIELIIEGTDI